MDRRLHPMQMAALVVLVVGILAILGLAAAGSRDDGDDPTATTFVVERPNGVPPPPAGARASGPLPAVVEKPARGPAFGIARLRPGARAALWRRPGHGFVTALGPRTEFGSPVVLSVVRRDGGWIGVSTPARPDGRLGWIRWDPAHVDLYWTKYWLRADLSARRLTLVYGDRPVRRFVVTVGGPGSETPTGRFAVTDALRFDESPYYGCCALALSGHQTHLPIGWLGGDRIAIHGTPGAVGGAESHGCLRATDATMRLLFARLPLGAPVFVRE